MALQDGKSLNQLCLDLLKQSVSLNTFQLPKKLQASVLTKWASTLKAIVLFGSKVRQTETSASDIDLLLVFDSQAPIHRELYREWQTLIDSLRDKSLEKYSPQFVSLPETARQAGSLWSEVALEGVVIWESGSEVSRILREIRSRIASGEMVRKLTHGQPYWVRKDEVS